MRPLPVLRVTHGTDAIIPDPFRMPPSYMLEIGKTAHEFFEASHSFGSSAPKKFRLKAMETYSREHGVVEQPSKRYFQATTLPDIINSYPFSKKGMTAKEIDKGKYLWEWTATQN